MVDPDAIQVLDHNLADTIKIGNVPPYEGEIYNLLDDKEYRTYIKDIERNVRQSSEYRNFVKYLRENMNMNKDAFQTGVSNEEQNGIVIELHHYPFSLADIVEIVIKKREYYHESMSVQMVSKEVMSLHYKFMVSLVPLSETNHKLFHNHRLFINVNNVLGRYKLFVDYYRPFITPEMMDTLNRIEKYSNQNDMTLMNTTIIEPHKVRFEIKDPSYQLPDLSNVADKMQLQIDQIKNNMLTLPGEVENESDQHKIIKPFYIDPSIIKH